MTIEIVTLEFGKHRLQLVPALGGGVASWNWKSLNGWTPLFRPWDGASDDRYSLACFPLVPWSNRITGGGFEHEGKFFPIQPNRNGEAYPIHGDGWLQAWNVSEHLSNRIRLSLESNGHDGNPYRYESTQTFKLMPNGLGVELSVTNRGDLALPFGLGLHPYFLRNDKTRLRYMSSGVWLSDLDPIPVSHSSALPDTWDYNQPAPLDGPLIDNCFSGWDGEAMIEYPDRRLTLTMSMADCNGYSLMYRPPGLRYFCLEPITHPIDAFHMPGTPGLAVLAPGESLALRTTFQIS